MVVRRIQKVFMVMACLGVLAAAGCDDKAGQEDNASEYAIVKEYKRDGLEVTQRIDKESVKLWEIVELEIIVSLGDGYEVETPSIEDAAEQFRVRDAIILPDKLGEEGKIIKAYRYQLEPLKPGAGSIGEIEIEFWSGADKVLGERNVLTTDPVEIEITSTLAGDPEQMAIADIEDIVEPEHSKLFWWIGGGGAIFLAAGLILLSRVRSRKQSQIRRIFRPAHEIAYEILRQIAEEKLVEEGRIREFYDKLSDCLRHYIEYRFKLRAPERTTEEFLLEVQGADVLIVERQEDLKRFLEHCDLVKFAKYQPDAEQINGALEMVKDFVDKTKDLQCQIDVTEKQAENAVEVKTS